MKKIVRTVWISILSGLAFLVACTCTKGLTRSEKKQLKAERTAIMTQIDQKRLESQTVEDPGIMMSYKDAELQLRQRLNEINSLLRDEQAANENIQQMGNLNAEMDSLQQVIDQSTRIPCVYGPPTNDPGYKQWQLQQRRNDLSDRISQLRSAIQRREGACVYGSPEAIKKYGEETQRLKNQLQELTQQLQDLEKEMEENE
jgi:hypothetical protein